MWHTLTRAASVTRSCSTALQTFIVDDGQSTGRNVQCEKKILTNDFSAHENIARKPYHTGDSDSGLL